MSFTRRQQREFHGPRRSRGLAAVEFAITAPLLLMVMLAAAEIGRMIVQYDTLSHAVRDSARFVSAHAINGTTGVIDIADAVAPATNLVIYGNAAGTGRTLLPEGDTTAVTVADAGGDDIRVGALYVYHPMLGDSLPTFGLREQPIKLTVNLRVAVTMRAIS